MALYFSEDAPIQDAPTLQRLRAYLAKDPTNSELAEAIRDEDLRLRRAYFTNRRRMQIGAYLLLIGLVGTVACARWYVSLHPKKPMPQKPAERMDLARWEATRKRDFLAVGLMGGIVILSMGILALREREDFSDPSKPRSRPSIGLDGRFKEHWPRFRGPTGMGIVPPGSWPQKWNVATGENILWKTPLPMPGNSSPIIWGERIFLTGATKEKQEVLCFDRNNGALLWRATIKSSRKAKAEDEEAEVTVLDETGYAASTPTTDGQCVYALYATGDLGAVDFNGKVLWVRNLGHPKNSYGLATSLLLYNGKLIVQYDRGSEAEEGLSALLAIDPKNGAELWRTPRAVPNSWSTPIVVDTDAGPTIFTSANPWVIAYEPELGTEIWKADGLAGDVAPSPVFADGVVFVTNERAKVMAVRAGGIGDVTATHVLWSSEEGALSDASSPICDGRYFLQAHSSGEVTCYDAKEGKLLWEKRLEGAVWASPSLVGKLVYLPTTKGIMHIFELAGEFREVSSGTIDEPIFASPAFADGEIYIRGKNHLFAIGKR